MSAQTDANSLNCTSIEFIQPDSKSTKLSAELEDTSKNNEQLMCNKSDTKKIEEKSSIFVPLTEQTLSTIVSENAIIRRFDNHTLEYDQEIIKSASTYWGMTESLINLASCLNQNEIKSIYVLCTHYRSTYNTRTNKMEPSDTQACGGGIKRRVWNNNEKKYEYKKTVNAAVELMAERFRIKCTKKPFCTSKVHIHNDSNFKNEKLNIAKKKGHSHIFAINASECYPSPNFEIELSKNKYMKKYEKENYISFGKVGYIVWGTLNECIDLVQGIPLDGIPGSQKVLIDNIDGISIISLSKAIEMSYYASRNLLGKPIRYDFF